MPEIKSTLDIIMEKAKKFSVTEEDKQSFKRQELEGKIRGLVQKTLDGILDSERFQVELARLQTQDKSLVDPIVQEEVVSRLEAEGNSEALIEILKNIAGPAALASVEKALVDFGTKTEKQKELRRKALREGFKKKGISGSAVLPNLDAEPEWAQARSELKRQLQEAIREVIEKGG